ncbi:MAG: hypothetical protein DCC71_21930 [Proteobacteria bacterium]|nr:MAG: hypothetical protein DCC71_21930 [Pseudomonadota bacterium]
MPLRRRCAARARTRSFVKRASRPADPARWRNRTAVRGGRVRPTGITILDGMVGGFPSGLPLVVAGPSGSGRTVLALALAHHALVRGEPVCFLTPETAPSLMREAASLGFELDAALHGGRLVFLELHANAPALVREHGVEPLVEAMAAEMPDAGVVIVDPLSALLAEIADEPRLRELTRGLARALERHDVVFTVESDRPTVQQALAVALSDLCGAYFALSRHPDARRFLTVEKTRTGLGATERVEFTIGPGGVQGVLEGRAPARRDADRSLRAAADAVPATPKRCARILVVEDERVEREMLTESLAGHYDVLAVADGFQAMTSLVSSPPDLVVLDLVMPRVSGYELLFAMRRARMDVPVLVASGRIATIGDRLGPLVLGATEFISKPVSRVELLHKVETLLRLPRSPESKFAGPEADALFGSFSSSRLLETGDFAERVGRACDFGQRYGMESSLAAIATASGRELDRWIDVANQQLRYEDAILRVEKQVALLLLVATAPQYVPRVIDRLAELGDGARLAQPHVEVWPARPQHARADAIEALVEPLRIPSEATP